MTQTIDLNADLGEGFGPWRMGDDAALLGIVSSANIACGAHAGDPGLMLRTFRAAAAAGVAPGAHPGFADLQGFGRRRLTLGAEDLEGLILHQIGAAQAMARATGVPLAHAKLHGALSNMASEDGALAQRCFAAIAKAAPGLGVFILPGTAMGPAAEAARVPVAAEVFADRAYAPDATLLPRGTPGAVIEDAATAAARALTMVRTGRLPLADGSPGPQVAVDTICVHGDTDGAVAIARAVREALTGAGYRLRSPFAA